MLVVFRGAARPDSPGQIRVSIFQLGVLVTVPQLTLHARIATLILLILLHRSLASILILRFLHRWRPRPTITLGEAQRDPKGWQPLGKKSHGNHGLAEQ